MRENNTHIQRGGVVYEASHLDVDSHKAVFGGYHFAIAQATHKFDGCELVDKTGNLRNKPADYRDLYQLLGTFTVLDPKGNQMHVTYASPGTAEYYRKTGKFPDGAGERNIWNGSRSKLTTGDAHWAWGTKVWFIKIKDEKHRFPQNALWGDGWGWFLYKSDAPDKQVATDYKKDCLSCHVPAQSTDWTYVQGFPVLKSK